MSAGVDIILHFCNAEELSVFGEYSGILNFWTTKCDMYGVLVLAILQRQLRVM